MIEIRQEYLESIDSTNNEIKRRAQLGAQEGLVISAGMQTAGRGRRGHQWESPNNVSIATSLLLRPSMAAGEISSLTLVAALAVRQAVERLYGLETLIKWPNDVIIQGKKVCGILTEMSARDGYPEYVVIGIGVNVHTMAFPEELQDKAISIDQALEASEGAMVARGSRKELTRAIWEAFVMLYEVFSMTGDLSVVMEEYNRYLVNRNAKVRVMDPQGAWEGIARGINSKGELLVETKDDLRCVDAGEVSVQGVYGYVF